MNMSKRKIVVTGAAGLVGQNLIHHLLAHGGTEIVAIDKHPRNTETLKALHPSIRVVCHDLAVPGAAGILREVLDGCDVLVIAHAQIGGARRMEFERNNIVATERLLDIAVRLKIPYLVSISSSVVNSVSVDCYTETKKAQEVLVARCGIRQVVLRPTLMFGWFDRKHLGWLARFMHRSPIFPVPGSGRFLRQPLFASDLCKIIVSSILNGKTGTYNITGHERIDYIDLVRAVKQSCRARARIQRIPYGMFWLLLRANSLFDKDPAFTVDQLRALVTPDVFEVIDWPGIFGVTPTPLYRALDITFQDPTYSKVVLEF